MGGVGHNPVIEPDDLGSMAFHRNQMRPDWIITGDFTEEQRALLRRKLCDDGAPNVAALVASGHVTVNEARGVWGDAFDEFMGVVRPTRPAPQVPPPKKSEYRCRYCKHKNPGDKCPECGAPQ